MPNSWHESLQGLDLPIFKVGVERLHERYSSIGCISELLLQDVEQYVILLVMRFMLPFQVIIDPSNVKIYNLFPRFPFDDSMKS